MTQTATGSTTEFATGTTATATGAGDDGSGGNIMVALLAAGGLMLAVGAYLKCRTQRAYDLVESGPALCRL